MRPCLPGPCCNPPTPLPALQPRMGAAGLQRAAAASSGIERSELASRRPAQRVVVRCFLQPGAPPASPLRARVRTPGSAPAPFPAAPPLQLRVVGRPPTSSSRRPLGAAPGGARAMWGLQHLLLCWRGPRGETGEGGPPRRSRRGRRARRGKAGANGLGARGAGQGSWLLAAAGRPPPPAPCAAARRCPRLTASPLFPLAAPQRRCA